VVDDLRSPIVRGLRIDRCEGPADIAPTNEICRTGDPDGEAVPREPCAVSEVFAAKFQYERVGKWLRKYRILKASSSDRQTIVLKGLSD
jgi:hypothetical protein